MIQFEIPYPPNKKAKSVFCRNYGLNAYYAGKHWAQRKKDAEVLHAMTFAAMRKAGIERGLLEYPVEVYFHWDDGLDADNHAVIGKAIVDAMCKYILQNDNRKWLKGVHHQFWDGGAILVEVKPVKEGAKHG